MRLRSFEPLEPVVGTPGSPSLDLNLNPDLRGGVVGTQMSWLSAMTNKVCDTA